MPFDYSAIDLITNQDFKSSHLGLRDKCDEIARYYQTREFRKCCEEVRMVLEDILRYLYKRIMGIDPQRKMVGQILSDSSFKIKLNNAELIRSAEQVNATARKYHHPQKRENETKEQYEARIQYENTQELPIETEELLTDFSKFLSLSINYINENISSARGKLSLSVIELINEKTLKPEKWLEADLQDVDDRKQYKYQWELKGKGLLNRVAGRRVRLAPTYVGQIIVCKAINTEFSHEITKEYGPIKSDEVSKTASQKISSEKSSAKGRSSSQRSYTDDTSTNVDYERRTSPKDRTDGYFRDDFVKVSNSNNTTTETAQMTGLTGNKSVRNSKDWQQQRHEEIVWGADKWTEADETDKRPERKKKQQRPVAVGFIILIALVCVGVIIGLGRSHKRTDVRQDDSSTFGENQSEVSSIEAKGEEPILVETPLDRDRQTYTNEHPASYAVFNSITNNAAVGDERNFVRVRELVSGTKYSDEVEVTAGHEYEVYIYFHNNASTDTNETGYGVATAVRAASAYPVELLPGDRGMISGILSWSYVKPDDETVYIGKVWDEAYLTTSEPVELRYKIGSAIIHNGGDANGSYLSDDLFTNDGTYIGYNKLGGVIPGCAEYSGYISYTLVAEAK